MRTTRRLVLAATVAATAAMVLAQPAWAARPGGGHGDWHGGWHGPHGDWHESHGDWHGPVFHSDGRFFDDHDWGLWKAGRWSHEWHDGRLGWWWVAGGIWYFYPAPVYPYPDPYAPPEVVAVAPQPIGSDLPQANTWYHCSSPDGYYPYVATCPSGWQSVPAETAGAPPQ
jgi:hypothetical protein